MWTPGIAQDRICTKDYNLGKPNDKATEDYIVRSIKLTTIEYHSNILILLIIIPIGENVLLYVCVRVRACVTACVCSIHYFFFSDKSKILTRFAKTRNSTELQATAIFIIAIILQLLVVLFLIQLTWHANILCGKSLR